MEPCLGVGNGMELGGGDRRPRPRASRARRHPGPSAWVRWRVRDDCDLVVLVVCPLRALPTNRNPPKAEHERSSTPLRLFSDCAQTESLPIPRRTHADEVPSQVSSPHEAFTALKSERASRRSFLGPFRHAALLRLPPSSDLLALVAATTISLLHR